MKRNMIAKERCNKMKAIMLQGTASDVGKSVICTAFCRYFFEEGFRVAPFKSQNMALNSYVTRDGGEIGRAQGIQAEAAGIEPTVDMNPVLLKPTGEMVSEVILHGRRFAELRAGSFHHELDSILASVQQSLNRLSRDYDVLVMEGAGSPAEINLKERDIANMWTARMADAPVLLIADIDRGGMFASVVGTLELLEPDERRRVKGIIINKFRGDKSLLEPGIRWLEQRTGIPVLGVLPYVEVGIDP
jgi:adenosylcobyric acid synthase